ncbi:MAG: 2-oxo-4-hydroxy-4-carboxy-5-ureidoimidazoline decarboxylase [Polyangiales bacterium]
MISLTEEALLRCNGSRAWAARMAAETPFSDEESLMGRADAIWWSLDRKDWDEAFSAHPRIGSKKDVEKKPEKSWSSREQAGAAAANDDTLAALAQANADYEARFGRIYIVCATGKSAEEMLAIARSRLHNDPETEVRIAAEEQRKITRLRLHKLLMETKEPKAMSHAKASITTHVLDTALGKPARGVKIVLEHKKGDGWAKVGSGQTDDDGRLKTLVPEGAQLEAGTYRITFDTGAYQEGFFPEVSITFAVRDPSQHHHVPLLLSPFGYSTYRGS